jgi:3-oxoadipate enol-lactonase/4-carboxymuconolactone decarboxylase
VKGIVGALSAMRDRPDSTPGLAELEGLPTLVVVGDQDQITGPAVARKISDAVPGAMLSVIPGAGHLPPVEQPISTTRVLAEFLQSLP